MKKKVKNNFEIKLKFLEFFYLLGIMSPVHFSTKMDNWGESL